MHNDESQKIAAKAEKIYNQLLRIDAQAHSVHEVDKRLDSVRREIQYAEERLYKVHAQILKEIKCVSIHLLKLIRATDPDAPILNEFAKLLDQEEKWCAHKKSPSYEELCHKACSQASIF